MGRRASETSRNLCSIHTIILNISPVLWTKNKKKYPTAAWSCNFDSPLTFEKSGSSARAAVSCRVNLRLSTCHHRRSMKRWRLPPSPRSPRAKNLSTRGACQTHSPSTYTLPITSSLFSILTGRPKRLSIRYGLTSLVSTILSWVYIYSIQFKLMLLLLWFLSTNDNLQVAWRSVAMWWCWRFSATSNVFVPQLTC